MNFEVIKSKYTAKDVKKLLTFKRLIKMTSVQPMSLLYSFVIFFVLSTLIFSCITYLDTFGFNLYSKYREYIIWLIPLVTTLCLYIYLYQTMIGKNKAIILGYYREADRLCKDLLADQIKSGLFHVDVCVDTQNDELVAVIKGDNFGIKRVYHFDRYLQQIIDEEKKVIDLSKLDLIFGLNDV